MCSDLFCLIHFSVQAVVLQGQLLDVQEDGGAEAEGVDQGVRETGEEDQGAQVPRTVEEEGRGQTEECAH